MAPEMALTTSTVEGADSSRRIRLSKTSAKILSSSQLYNFTDASNTAAVTSSGGEGDTGSTGKEVDCPKGDMKAICQLLRSFKVCGTCAAGDAALKRIGSPNDGGYVQCTDGPKPDGALSLGIAGYDDWGIQISELYGITTYEFDCTNSKRPICQSSKCKLQFFDVCVRASHGSLPASLQGKKSMTLTEMFQTTGLSSSQNLLLQIDTEGAEWEVFRAATAAELLKFSQIIVEFHGVVDSPEQRLETMHNLLKHFTVVHTHGNNCCPERALGKFHIPNVFEMTLLRNDLAKKSDRCASSAHPELDRPNTGKPALAPPELPERERRAANIISAKTQPIGQRHIEEADSQVRQHTCDRKKGDVTIGWDGAYGRSCNSILSFLHAVTATEASGATLYVDPGHWVHEYLAPVYDLENLVNEFSCVRLQVGLLHSTKVTAKELYYLRGVCSDIADIAKRKDGSSRGLSFKVVPMQYYRQLYNSVKASHKEECFHSLGHVLNLKASEISDAVSKSPLLPAKMGYVVIHIRWLEGTCVERVKRVGSDVGFCDMDSHFVRQKIDEHGVTNLPVIIIGDAQEHSRRAADTLMKELGLKITDLMGKTSIAHDLLIGIHSAIFIGNSASTFAGYIAYTRIAFGRERKTNVGTSEMIGLRHATDPSIDDQFIWSDTVA